jgi:hypothetical protein
MQAFRRPECPGEQSVWKLRGLDPEGKYILTDWDAPQPREISGRDLMETGLTVTLPRQESATVIQYKKINP